MFIDYLVVIIDYLVVIIDYLVVIIDYSSQQTHKLLAGVQ